MWTLGFAPARADPDMLIKKDPGHKMHSCTSTHVDDFLIIGTNKEPIMEAFKKKFDMRHEEINPTSYLRLQWKHSELGKCKIHNEKCIKEAIFQVEKYLGIQLKKGEPKCHPVLEETRILIDQKINDCQKFVGTLQ